MCYTGGVSIRALFPRCTCLLAAVLFAVTSIDGDVRAQVVADPFESSVAMLRQATHAQPDGSHLPLLFALRQLRDPDLKSLFLQLTQEGGTGVGTGGDNESSWPIQVHAVLGLAEIDPSKQIDPWLITRIDADAQEAVIAAALDNQLLPQPAIAEILKWDQLHPMARLFLLAEQVSLNQPADAEDLARLSKSEDSHVAGLASSLLAQTGNAEPLKSFTAHLASKSAADRYAVTGWMMDGARRYKLTAMSDWIANAIAADDADLDLVYRGAVALLSLDQTRGIPAWEKYLGSEPTFPHRVRCGIILLTAREKAPASAYDRLLPAGKDEELVAAIANVGKAIASGSDPADALIALLDIGHAKSSMWVMEYLNEVPPEHSRRVFEYLIDRLSAMKPQWTEAIAQAVDATTRLFAIDPDAVLKRLAEAEDDSGAKTGHLSPRGGS